MVLWMLVYSISLIFKKHSKDRALCLREHYIKYLAFPILGMNVKLEGEQYDKPALYVANHRSFSDPIIICRYIKAFVVAKAEVANYPIISQGAQLTGILYVKREEKDSRNAVRQMIIDTIKNGHSVLVFPEGTVGVKQGTMDFKIGAFAEALKNEIPIIPIALEYKSTKDLWLLPHFVNQFLLMYTKPITFSKMSIGKPINTDDVVTTSDAARHWIEVKLSQMQHNWSEIDYSKYENE